MVYSEGSLLLSTIFSELSRLFNDHIRFDDMVNILFDEKDNIWMKDNINFNHKDYLSKNVDKMKILFRKKIKSFDGYYKW